MPSEWNCVRMILRSVFVCATAITLTATQAPAQTPESAKHADQATKPAPRYANMPDEAVPYGKFAKPYKEWFVTDDTLDYFGAARARDYKDLEESPSVSIGFLGPIENNYESPYGLAMLHGAQLAVEQANAKGGFHPAGSPPKLYEL